MRLSRLMLLGVLALGACRRESTEPAPAKAVQALWQPSTRMGTARSLHTATVLPSGKVLVLGGVDGLGTNLKTSETWDPATDSWAPSAACVNARNLHRAILLGNGKVLAIGGANGLAGIAFAELYDEATNTWASASGTIVGRVNPTATLLPNGRVLVAGGYSAASPGEVYDPTTNTWASTSMTTPRLLATATLLPNGKVLVAGGTVMGTTVASAELYDPATFTWAAAGNLAVARQRHTAQLLSNGKVLVAGGSTSTAALGSAELYDPATNTWSAAPSMSVGRALHASTLLPSGKVLITGGSTPPFGGLPPLTSSELYDPASNTWIAAGTMTIGRVNHTATLLSNGKVLLTGGDGLTGGTPWAELYEPTVGGIPCTTGATCPSGNCVDGLCCDSACSGPCDSCDLPGSPGVCAINPARTPGTPSCFPFVCSGSATTCPVACAGDGGDCAVGRTCTAGTCLLALPQGSQCISSNDCTSGFCVDGRCCNSACAGACDTCNQFGTCVGASGSAGNPSCTPFVCAGSVNCPTTCTSSSECIPSFACDAGACISRAALGTPCTSGTQCASLSCIDGVCCNGQCNGDCNACNLAGSAGTCSFRDAGVPGSPGPCTPYLCSGVGALCPFQCSPQTGCAAGYRCSGDAGFCVTKTKLGSPCGQANDCATGNCVDGLCCDTTCGGPCDACNLDGSMGTCLVQPVGFAGAPSCSPYLCGGANGCPTSCASDLECTASSFCLDGGCTEKRPQGTGCLAPVNCASGFCTDGVCCSSACAGNCDTCNAAGSCTLFAEGAEGTPSCAPYMCTGTSGKCRGTCTTDAQCVPPNLCSHGFCTTKPVETTMPPAKGCGCQAGSGAVMPFLLVLGAMLRRRKSRKERIRT